MVSSSKRLRSRKLTPHMQKVVKAYQLIQARFKSSMIPEAATIRNNIQTTKTNTNSMKNSKKFNEVLPKQTHLSNTSATTSKKRKYSDTFQTSTSKINVNASRAVVSCISQTKSSLSTLPHLPDVLPLETSLSTTKTNTRTVSSKTSQNVKKKLI